MNQPEAETELNPQSLQAAINAKRSDLTIFYSNIQSSAANPS